ncbi:MAG TPA: hypothetical protein VL418_05185 [Devosiaceae bacterium]|nr:hypothetical protein [Devosiaceae bacterium]
MEISDGKAKATDVLAAHYVEGERKSGRSAIIVTGADANYFPYAKELVISIRAAKGQECSIGFYDLGLEPEQNAWLQDLDVAVKRPNTLLELDVSAEISPNKLGYLARPFLRENFPGYDTYVWMDADAWLQSGAGLDLLLAAARERGAAFIRQNDPSYKPTWWLRGWMLKHFVLGYGVLKGLYLFLWPHINNGVFAMQADAPHWEEWRRRYQGAYDRTSLPAPHDQFSLNAAVVLGRLKANFAPPTLNWICDLSPPKWDPSAKKLCRPLAPHEVIDIVHLAGPAKTATFDIASLDGGTVRTGLRYSSFHSDAPVASPKDHLGADA